MPGHDVAGGETVRHLLVLVDEFLHRLVEAHLVWLGAFGIVDLDIGGWLVHVRHFHGHGAAGRLGYVHEQP
jgi:hypothetical protein